CAMGGGSGYGFAYW
nr:immunoglobulin heavy chain junction region [Mus musculus]